MRVANFSGGHFQVGYQLGQWWVGEIKRLRRSSAGRQFLDSEHGEFEEQLANSWDESYLPLLSNVLRHFPELIEEINGIAQGAKDAGFKTSFLDVFVVALGETEIPRQNCTSFVAKTKNGYLLGHNEEEHAGYPLCFAKVHLKTEKKVVEFFSVSYPFELFGTSAGMNKHFAFQGNSIGCEGKYEQLFNTWDKRIPKTVFSRKMLELRNIEDIANLYAKHNSSLPNHQYLVTLHEAHSIEIRPLINKVDVWRQFIIRKVEDDLDLNTNHLYRRGKVDQCWRWKDNNKESKLRLERLNQAIYGQRMENRIAGMDVLTQLRMSCTKHTLASIVFELEKGGNKATAKSYFGGRQRNIDTVTINHF